MKLDYATYLANPELRSRLEAEARRERALTMARLVFEPVAALFQRLQSSPQRSASTVFPAGCR